MTLHIKNNAISGNSIKGIHEHWSILDEDEQETSLKNFIKKVKVRSQ